MTKKRLFVEFADINIAKVEDPTGRLSPSFKESDGVMCWACWKNKSDLVLVDIDDGCISKGLCRECLGKMQKQIDKYKLVEVERRIEKELKYSKFTFDICGSTIYLDRLMMGRIIGRTREGLFICRVGGNNIFIPKTWINENTDLNTGDFVNFEVKDGSLQVVVKEALDAT